MKVRRLAAAVAAAALAGGGALLALSSTGNAATPPPTPISLEATGLGTSFCPLPVNGTVAIKPNAVLFKPGTVSGVVLPSVSLTVLSEAQTNPPQQPRKYSVPSSGYKLSFSSPGTYDLSWSGSDSVLGVGLLSLSSKAKLIISNDVQNCQVAVQVPTPAVSVQALPSGVNSTVNGLVGGVVSGANGALAPVNSAVGSALGQVNGIAGGASGGLPVPGSGSGSGAGGHSSGPGTTYKPTGPTVAQRRMPDGYGSGSGQGGSYVAPGAVGDSITAAGSSGTTGGTTGKKSGQQQPAAKSGGSPKTVELAANKPRSALDGWASIIVLVAVLALSGATAFYARTYLLHPAPAQVRS